MDREKAEEAITGKMVLIVDDEQDVLDTLIELLHMCKIDAASSFAEAKQFLETMAHDVAILDIMGLKHQLAQLRVGDRLDEVLTEVTVLRQEFGYPIMVTPFSQFLVTQATLNVVSGNRYGQVIDELIKYALGFWGEEASSSIDPNVKDRILSLPRARELSGWEVGQPTVKEVKKSLGAESVGDEEMLLRYIVQDDKAIEQMRAAGPPREYPIASKSVAALIQELIKQKDLSEVWLQKGDFSLRLRGGP